MVMTVREARARTDASRGHALVLAEEYRKRALAPGATSADRIRGEAVDLILKNAATAAVLVPRDEAEQKLGELHERARRLDAAMEEEMTQLAAAGDRDMSGAAAEALRERYLAQRSAAEAELRVWLESYAEAAWSTAWEQLAMLEKESGAVASEVSRARH